ncbi:hypothetical protein SAMN02745857_01981 [Andreprevotia lacus DSM 23236]|uniref:Uncharacterized protein n=1 Tax=Andreprevotia lacus DSM 23236 TaxID=1121001 RepID=A0A1W1XLX6_9NEIS|nr:hypothetical protein [Andreprevotia lacus]SMC24837.1 hypothetical protein SAMN02745857_01981 [Andreprevotia lacus DSM 23236]
MRDTLFPIILIIFGAGWLVSELHLLPDANWIVILGLIAGGMAVLVAEGLNRSSIVTGPLLIAGGLATFVHDHNEIGWRFLVPVLMMLWGLLLLLGRALNLPERVQRMRRRRIRWGEGDLPDA